MFIYSKILRSSSSDRVYVQRHRQPQNKCWQSLTSWCQTPHNFLHKTLRWEDRDSIRDVYGKSHFLHFLYSLWECLDIRRVGEGKKDHRECRILQIMATAVIMLLYKTQSFHPIFAFIIIKCICCTLSSTIIGSI